MRRQMRQLEADRNREEMPQQNNFGYENHNNDEQINDRIHEALRNLADQIQQNNAAQRDLEENRRFEQAMRLPTFDAIDKLVINWQRVYATEDNPTNPSC